uniref:HABP4_PAI-RBP1 domain-containing protein n=1 Tax=Ascaris lumbricoides TaxID=6252 RepID=A0A0M3ICG6_ASCLU
MQINLQADSNKQEKHPQWDSVFSVVEGKPKALPETAANGKFVSEEGQEWTKTVSKQEDERIEAEVLKLYESPT